MWVSFRHMWGGDTSSRGPPYSHQVNDSPLSCSSFLLWGSPASRLPSAVRNAQFCSFPCPLYCTRQGFPTTGSCSRWVVSCVLFTLEIRQSQQKFDALNYVLGPYLYCYWSLVFVAFWRRILQRIVIVRSFLRLPKLHKIAVRKLDLLRGDLTRCHGVLDHGLNLHQNIPLKESAVIINPGPHIYMFWGVNDSYLPEAMNHEHKSRLRRTVSHDLGNNLLLAVPRDELLSPQLFPRLIFLSPGKQQKSLLTC